MGSTCMSFAKSCWQVLYALSIAGATLAQAQEPLRLIPSNWSRQPIIAVPPARPAPPKIDGYVDYKEWFYAAHVLGFLDMDTGCAPAHPVGMYLCYDKDALYIGIVINRPPMNPTPRATVAAGPTEHLWWKDDGFELVVEPGSHGSKDAKDAGIRYGYAFCGNSIGAWSDLRYELAAGQSDASWTGKWEYKASRPGLDSWHAEMKIPASQFEGGVPPAPGVEWRLAVMNQQVTPLKKMIDWTMMWSFGEGSYASRNKARLLFIDEGPIFRFSEWGKLRPASKEAEKGPEKIGLRCILYNQGKQPYTLNGRADLFRFPDKRPAGVMTFYDLWDRLRHVRETGQPLRDPKDPTQAFRSEADLLKELNDRYQPVTSTNAAVTVASGGAGYFPLEVPLQRGEYLLSCQFTDAKEGRVLASQVAPFQVLPGLDLQLRPYFLTHQKLRAEASVRDLAREGDGVKLSLAVDGKELDSTTVKVSQGAEAVTTYLSARAWPPEKTGRVRAELIGADGKACMSSEASLLRPRTPEWFGKNLGRSKVVPPPFEPVSCPASNIAQVWQRRYRFGTNGLPESITTRGSELLARPMTLTLKAGGNSRKNSKGDLRRVRSDGRDAVFEAQQRAVEWNLTTTAAVHYDGCVRFDVTVSPAHPLTLDSLALEIPVAKRWAHLFTHNGTSTDYAKTNNDGLGGNVQKWFDKYPAGAMPFTWAFFLGSYDRGLQWFCESDRGWSNQDENRKISLIRTDEAVTLRIAFVDKPVKLTQPLRFNFGMMVTPVKDPSDGLNISFVAHGQPDELRKIGLEQLEKDMPMFRERGGTAISSYMSDPDHFGTPRMYNAEDEKFLTDFVALCHKYGLKYAPYSGWGVNTNVPDFETFGAEMLKEPLRNAGWGCYWHNPASTFADWWLDSARYVVQQCGFDGIYMDGTCYPELTGNELDGKSWKDEQGSLHGTYPIWAIRDFIERLYVMLHHELRKDGIVHLHDGREPLYFIAGFSDLAVSGEYHLSRGKTILEVFDPDEFAAYYVTHLNGVARNFIWWNWMKLPIYVNEMQSMALLHDTPLPAGGGLVKYYGTHVGYGQKTETWVRLRAIRSAFDDATFIPYWEARKPATVEPAGPLTSAWVDSERRRALVMISNLTTEPWKGQVRFNPAVLRIDPAAEAVDAMFDKPLGHPASASFTVSLEPQRYRLFIFNARVPLPDHVVPDGTER